MEIEKKRETSWKIQLKEKNETISLTSVEISGVVRFIKFALLKNDKTTKVELNKEEFFNFLSILSAFKDVVIGDDSLILEEELKIIENTSSQVQEYSNLGEELYHHKEGSSDKQDYDTEELNPEEWDPW